EPRSERSRTEMESKLREMFDRRGNDVSVPPVMPGNLRRRTRLFRLRYGVGALVIAVATYGAAVGIQSLARSEPRIPTKVPSPHPPSPVVPHVTMSRTNASGVVLEDLQGEVVGTFPNLPARAHEVTVSPDGHTIAFSRADRIYTIGVDGTNLRA